MARRLHGDGPACCASRGLVSPASTLPHSTPGPCRESLWWPQVCHQQALPGSSCLVQHFPSTQATASLEVPVAWRGGWPVPGERQGLCCSFRGGGNK